MGKGDGFEFVGVGEEKMRVGGVVYGEVRGGKVRMRRVRVMGEEGGGWGLVDGRGMI